MDEFVAALDRADAAATTKPIPAGAPARMRFLVRALRGTSAAATELGVSQRTVERYVRGQLHQPRSELADRLERAVRSRWQPRVRAAARRRAAQTGGIVIETRARFGFTAAPGSTDDARIRLITQHLPPEYAARLLDAHAAGAGEQQLRQIAADGLGEVYFRDRGRRADGLQVEFGDVDFVELELG
ncbi:telomere-protecting terminal protein Tpg [Streptomyces otsuchiensis]|uniref:telomere-protecting terminal protein Tpg n=1 Tax=Streptomyces otsuchiensis TaxID=2681388 RepID=UPI001031E251|nr:XRE family transcriptional regulator [Streptomyces otsuchiensis]